MSEVIRPDVVRQLEALVLPARLHQAVLVRLEAGAREYGDRSLERPEVELLGEVHEELVDAIGWTCLLLARLRRCGARDWGALELGDDLRRLVATIAEHPHLEPWIAARLEEVPPW